jgi:hypothetical protein
MASAKNRLSNMKLSEVTLCRKGKVPGAVVTLFKAAQTKTEGGKSFSSSDYAYVGDPGEPSTWKLRIVEEPGGKPTAHQIGMAAAALSSGGFRGNKVELPSEAVAGVKAKLRRAWQAANPDKSADDMPASLAKSAADPDDDGDVDTLDFSTALARNKLRDQVQSCCSDMWQAWSAFQDSVMSIAAGDPTDGDKPLMPADRKAALKDTIDQFTSWLEDQIPALAVAKAISKGLHPGGAGADPSSTHEDIIMTMEELAKALEKAQADIAALTKSASEKDAEIVELKKAAKAKDKGDAEDKKDGGADEDEEDLKKALPPALRAIVEKSQKDAAAAIAKATKLEEDRAIEASIAKAAPLVGVMPTDAAQLGKLLHEVRKAAPQHADELERLFKATAAMMADTSLLFEAIGKAGGEDGGGSGALAELNSKAGDIRKAEPALSEQQAFAKAMTQNPALYARYQQEARGL